jgi:hypothetical protein
MGVPISPIETLRRKLQGAVDNLQESLEQLKRIAP